MMLPLFPTPLLSPWSSLFSNFSCLPKLPSLHLPKLPLFQLPSSHLHNAATFSQPTIISFKFPRAETEKSWSLIKSIVSTIMSGQTETQREGDFMHSLIHPQTVWYLGSCIYVI
jgi:hypothetical protein